MEGSKYGKLQFKTFYIDKDINDNTITEWLQNKKVVSMSCSVAEVDNLDNSSYTEMVCFVYIDYDTNA